MGADCSSDGDEDESTLLWDVGYDEDEMQTYECLECGTVVAAETDPGSCPECGATGLRNVTMPIE